MLPCIDGRSRRRGLSIAQSAVEAAVVLPCFLTLLLLLVQPICLLYTRSIMEAAAAETSRLMVTGVSDSKEACKAFALRRLAAVPDVSIFHVGGPMAWDIELKTSEELEGEVRVVIEGAARPLPMIGAFARGAFGTNGTGDIVLNVEVQHAGRPQWLQGGYEEWTEWG